MYFQSYGNSYYFIKITDHRKTLFFDKYYYQYKNLIKLIFMTLYWTYALYNL